MIPVFVVQEFVKGFTWTYKNLKTNIQISKERVLLALLNIFSCLIAHQHPIS